MAVHDRLVGLQFGGRALVDHLAALSLGVPAVSTISATPRWTVFSGLGPVVASPS